MLLSIAEELRSAAYHPEIEGRRILVSGLSSGCGIDIARAFAEHRARLILRVTETCPETDAVAALLAAEAMDVRLYSDPAPGDADAAVAFMQGPAQQAFGGLDGVINVITLTPGDLCGCEGYADFENLVSRKLLAPTLAGRVAANRMRLTLTEGMILNVVVVPQVSRLSPEHAEVVGLLRATVAAVTRGEARKWADQSIRINAVVPGDGAPEGLGLAGEADIGSLAVYLASDKGRSLAGHVFEASAMGIA